MKEQDLIRGNTNTDFLKSLAVVSMTIDHAGKLFAPDNLILQVIGRITFPLFAYCLVVGFLRTRSVSSYAKRLALFTVISQPFYVLAFGYKVYEPNIFLTLLLGLLSLWCLKDRKWLFYILVFVVSFFLNTDYGLSGLILINLIYLFRESRWKSWAVLFPFFVFTFLYNPNFLIKKWWEDGVLSMARSYSMNLFGFLALPLMYWPIGFRVQIPHWFFYIYYPAHLAVLAAIKQVIG